MSHGECDDTAMLKILVVEDNPDSMEILNDILTYHGYTVLLADNGRDAIHTALADRPDLILMDMSIPEINGWEASKIIRNDTWGRRVPIIALTAFTAAPDRTCLLIGNAGFVKCICKRLCLAMGAVQHCKIGKAFFFAGSPPTLQPVVEYVKIEPADHAFDDLADRDSFGLLRG